MLKFVTLFLCVSLIWASPASVKTRALGGRIIGGDEANAAQFPFAAAIYKQTATGTYFCAGALINDQWVLTAAQCVVEAVLFTIRLGSTSLTSNDANALRLATDSWWAHPDYNPDGFQNDIGLIRFRIAITFTDYIKPISVLATTSLPQSSSVITYGWGQVSDAVAGTSDILNYVFLTTLSNEECRLAYGTIVQDNHVCVEGNYNQLKMSEPFASVKDFEEHAFKVLPRNALDYFRSGAGAEQTLANNRTAFSKYKIRPRCLRNVAKRDLSVTVLGERIAMPIAVAPTALQRMAHPDGECATARAAQAMGTVFALSAAASSTIEEIAEAAPYGNNWLQLYIYKDREITRSLVTRAEKAGYKALLLTIDCPILGRRLADIRNNFVLPPHLTYSNFGGKNDGINNYFSKLLDPSLEWEDLKWIQSITTLPIVLKGILTAEDAIIAADLGFPAILVSNHGGRQLDGYPATIEVLPEIVKSVGHRIEIYMDGGITDGTDAYKALALGARMVLVGRPPVWGLTHGGEDGARKVLDILRTELDYALAITGCSSIRDIDSSMVVHQGYYSKL